MSTIAMAEKSFAPKITVFHGFWRPSFRELFSLSAHGLVRRVLFLLLQRWVVQRAQSPLFFLLARVLFGFLFRPLQFSRRPSFRVRHCKKSESMEGALDDVLQLSFRTKISPSRDRRAGPSQRLSRLSIHHDLSPFLFCSCRIGSRSILHGF